MSNLIESSHEEDSFYETEGEDNRCDRIVLHRSSIDKRKERPKHGVLRQRLQHPAAPYHVGQAGTPSGQQRPHQNQWRPEGELRLKS